MADIGMGGINLPFELWFFIFIPGWILLRSVNGERKNLFHEILLSLIAGSLLFTLLKVTFAILQGIFIVWRIPIVADLFFYVGTAYENVWAGVWAFVISAYIGRKYFFRQFKITLPALAWTSILVIFLIVAMTPIALLNVIDKVSAPQFAGVASLRQCDGPIGNLTLIVANPLDQPITILGLSDRPGSFNWIKGPIFIPPKGTWTQSLLFNHSNDQPNWIYLDFDIGSYPIANSKCVSILQKVGK
ncbi:MAG: hypothetical protein AABY04_01370 [Candidatus Micrarchaeota archaeon]